MWHSLTCNFIILHTSLDIHPFSHDNKMKTKLRRRLGISTVITTIIILVASVVLAAGVVLYATSLFQSGTLTETISITGVKVYVHATDSAGLAWGAFGVRNSGDKILSLDKISIRGDDIGFSSWFSNKTVTQGAFDSVYKFPGWFLISGAPNGTMIQEAPTCASGQKVRIELGGDGFCATAQTGPLSLGLGEKAVVYFQISNGTLTELDSGVTTNVSIFAGKAGAPLAVTIKAET